MKVPIFAAAMLCSLALCQDKDTVEVKHLTVPTLNGNRAVSMSALNVERGVEYPSVIRLNGNVEIRTPVCLPVGPENKLVCDGYMILRADEATFHEDTGAIEAHGNVSVIPLQHEHKRDPS
jgi:hypothetical protein